MCMKTFEKNGMHVIKSQEWEAKVTNGSMVMLSRSRKKCLYLLDGDVISGNESMVTREQRNSTRIWLDKLGHISHARGLDKLYKQNVFGGLVCSCDHIGFYEKFILGKAQRVKFGRGKYIKIGISD